MFLGFTWDHYTLKRLLRYTFFGGFILWIITTIFLVYSYVWTTSKSITSKGGTFVEGIFDNTSYLPYLRTDQQSLFYQGLLFNSCLKYSQTPQGAVYQEDLCQITSSDSIHYTVTMKPGIIRSDGTPLSLDDILYTYQDILVKNTWKIKQLASYKDIIVSKEDATHLKVTFPSASIDNKLFFTNYILPQHVLASFDLQSYREIFSIQPIYTNCANIVSQSSDQNSLIFNLVNCSNTHLNFYQIKNISSLSSFKQDLADKGSSIVDVYIGDEILPGYSLFKLPTNKIITVFFNTDSTKLRVRTRRALGGLIKRNFYSTGYESLLIKNSDGLFDSFMSTGASIKDFLQSTSNDEDAVAKKDLLDSGIKTLPQSISVVGENQKFVFFVESFLTQQALTVTTDIAYDKILLERNGKSYVDPNYASKDKKSTFSIGLKQGNFGTGLNKYTLWGWVKGAKKKIGTLDVYNLAPSLSPTPVHVTTGSTISFLYYDTPQYREIVKNIQHIFMKFGVQDFFSFESVRSAEELEGRILLGDYDILLNTIDMGLKKDFTKLFATSDAKINPTHYQNARLVDLLQSYSTDQKKRSLNEINSLYAKDMPFVILGKSFVPLNIKTNILEKVTGTGARLDLYDYNRRNVLYNKLILVNNVHIDGKQVWNYENFSNFIRKALGY